MINDYEYDNFTLSDFPMSLMEGQFGARRQSQLEAAAVKLL